ncbi:MAG TPA: DUF359 domain-containing protein [Archaeoglobus veneficus]|nr:DUF359 domain-containing protein [Archaeoglobus veneficus]
MLKLPKRLRAECRKPQGRLCSIESTNPIASVGDVVSYSLLRMNRKPMIIIFDGRTERRAFEKIDELEKLSAEYTRLDVRNPPSTITSELVFAIKRAVEKAEEGVKTKIFVKGEEDLAVLPLICLLPSGSVVYGQPGEGVVEVRITPEKKLLILQLMEQMEKLGRDGENGEDVINICRGWSNGSFRGEGQAQPPP